MDSFKVEVKCHNGGSGGVAVACLKQGDPYELKGCEAKRDDKPPCVSPASTVGYRIVEVHNLYKDGPFKVDVTCANGGAGAKVTECADPGGPYKLEGCENVVDNDPPCAKPTDTNGYRIVEEHSIFKDTFKVDVQCAHGGAGGKSVVCDKPGDPYKLTGCDATVLKDDPPCVKPEKTVGYRILTVHNIFKDGPFNVEVSCAHDGKVGVATACAKPGTAYTLSGCEPPVVEEDKPCLPPASTVGYRIEDVTSVYMDTFAVTVACAHGKAGAKAVVCEAPNTPYKLEGCDPQTTKDEKPCIEPEDTKGYRITHVHNVYIEGFDVKVTCAMGVEGGKATACDLPGMEYKLSGCEPIKKDDPPCTEPANLDGYRIVETESVYMEGFKVMFTCAAGYEAEDRKPAGTKTLANRCTTAGEPYVVFGCVRKTTTTTSTKPTTTTTTEPTTTTTTTTTPTTTTTTTTPTTTTTTTLKWVDPP